MIRRCVRQCQAKAQKVATKTQVPVELETAIGTKAVHAGEIRGIEGALLTPTFSSATYLLKPDVSDYHSIKYIRLNNTPNHQVLDKKIAALENTEAALVFASGMAAITTTMMTYLKAGDHVLVQNGVYGGTHTWLTHEAHNFGIEFDFVDSRLGPSEWQAKLKPNTKVFYVEGMSNPCLRIANLPGVVSFAKANNLLTMIDNTFLSPYNFRPTEIGFDLVLHSCTKFMNGHQDIVAGSVAGKFDLVEPVRHMLNHLGGSIDPHACTSLQRGLKTLALRMRQHNQNGMAVAQFLESHPAVKSVSYPGLASHPQHELAKSLFDGYGGMVAFDMKTKDEASILLSRLQIPAVTVSLGACESLVTRPEGSTHVGLSKEEQEIAGISESTVRLSLGIEDTEDLLNDLKQAISVL